MLNRIKGVLLQEFYISKWSIEIWMDIIFFPSMTALVFGFISQYLSGENKLASVYLILGMLLWQVVYISQYSISVGALWNVWSRNLSNMFISPLTIWEYMLAGIFSSTLKAVMLFSILSIMYAYVFNFNVLSIGIINIVIYVIILMTFAWSMGLIILGVIFKFGTRIQALAWGLIFLFQPLTAAFFPLDVLPPVLRQISLLLPPTYVFEAARANITNPSTDWNYILIASAFTVFYFISACFIFNYLFNKSRESAQFARNES